MGGILGLRAGGWVVGWPRQEDLEDYNGSECLDLRIPSYCLVSPAGIT